MLTADEVRIAYQLLLGREPESEAVVTAWRGVRSYSDLRDAFMASAEFRARVGATPPAPIRLVPPDAPPLDVEWQTDPANAHALLMHIKAVWTRLGAERPHWSVLSADRFVPENIEQSRAEFYNSGAADVAMLEACLRRCGLEPGQFRHVFEFGCGIGRVTPFLARSFAQVTAGDVSASHLEMARETVVAAGATNVAFSLAEGAEFAMRGPFDLWFSRIVLQHNPPPVIAQILRRAFSLLSPGGAAVFQVPTYATGYRFALGPYLGGMRADGGIEMHVLPQPVVLAIAQACGCDVLEIWQDQSAGHVSDWVSNTFVVRRKAAVASGYSASFRIGA